MYHKIYALLGVISIVLLFVFAPLRKEVISPTFFNALTINNQTFQVEVLDTDAERVRGLSGRESLPKDTVILFMFPKEDRYGIWMKDMHLSIDILWLDKNFKIVHIEQNVSPQTFPEIFYPSVPALYVAEANSNFVLENEIHVGDRVEFSQI